MSFTKLQFVTMGSGITKPTSILRTQFASDSYSDVMTNICNKSTSHLERVLRSDRKTSAFLKFLDQSNNGFFLTLYLDICRYQSMKNELILLRALKDTRSSYSQLSPHGSDIVSRRQELHDLVTEILLSQTITAMDIKKIEEICLLQLIDELQDFITSSHEFSKRFAHNKTVESSVRSAGDISFNTKTKGKNVLIIDDSPQNSWLITQELKAIGNHKIRQANHGWVGVHIASLNRFDVILVDLAMNTMDPYKVINRIKATCSHHNTFIIGLNYSEYDLKQNDNLLLSINMEPMESLPKDFSIQFTNILAKFEDISCDNYETCDTSMLSSSSISSN